tara:strand:+ start:1091 stop:2119 length:1029 start_codon:yes stop_codon:yes gene_type:complete
LRQGVTYYQLNSSTTNVPATAASGPYVDGFYGVDGTLETLIWRVTTVQAPAAGAIAMTTGLDALVSQFKLVINGEILYDWIAGIAPEQGSDQAGRFGYFLNQIGGRVLQVPTAAASTTCDIYMALPIGIVLSGTPRFEITYSFYPAPLILGAALANTTVTSGSSTFWARFNSQTQRSTRVISATSFQHGANLEQQVVARIPSMAGGYTLEMVSIQNATANADNYGVSGLRILALSQFSMPISLNRWASNDLGNGVMRFDPTVSTVAQSYSTGSDGILNVPLYGLKAGDLTMIVSTAGAACTRLYHPVLSAPLRGVEATAPRQTAVPSPNTQRSIVARTEGSN